MLRLALATLRTRKGAFAATFLALLLGSAVVSACGMLLESGLRSTVPPERYAAAPVVVSGKQEAELRVKSADGSTYESTQPLPERAGLDPAMASKIAAADGVRSVVADRAVTVRLVTTGGRPVAGHNGTTPQLHTWSGLSLGDFRLTAGRAPRGHGQVVVDSGLAARAGVGPGDSVRLMTSSTPRTVEVTGLVGLPDGRAPRQSVLFAADSAVDALTPRTPAAVYTFGVFPRSGTSAGEVASTVGRVVDDRDISVSRGLDRGRAEFDDLAAGRANLVELTTAIGGNVLLVAVFVLCATTALAIRHRRRELALLRAVGATPGQLRRMILAEAGVAGASAGVLGCPLGIGVVHWLGARFAGHGLVPPDFTPVVGPLPFLVAVATTVLTALVAAWFATRRITRIRPTEALGEAALEPDRLGRGRLITGWILVALAAAVFGLGLGYRADFLTLVGLANSLVLVLVIAVAVLGPALTRLAVRLLTRPLRATGVTGWLAAANTGSQASRMAGAVTPLVLAVSFAATVVFTQTTQLNESADQIRHGLVADHVLTAPAGLSPDLAEKARHVPGVKAATGVVRSKVVAVGSLLGEEEAVSLSAQGLDPRALTATVDLDPRAGSLSRLSPRTVAISRTTASWLGLDVGDRADLRLGDGTRFTGEVIAVYERGFGFADVTFDHDLLLAHTGDRVDRSVLVRSAPGAAGTDKALGELAAKYPGAAVSAGLATDTQVAEQRATAWVNYLVVAVIIAYTLITVVNTQAMNTSTRHREFALLRLTGTVRRQVVAMMRLESLVVVLTGLCLGSLLAAFPLMLVAMAVTGAPWPSVTVLGYTAIAGIAAAATIAGTMLTARLMLRARPIEAIGSKE
ncbi:putative ABC transport system permease protein [Streptomyces sp. V3I8]|uniref:ABC transporter permease n=1 Tax=Streptomyces sp. V3I8 TaxID=3042279 RepID=UPI002789E860|nr:FtsX-like permease family protein [Streptomyces sp. V3I8]MDQ1041230.1 putative ABC transport system permease protein [Streptomyces sp. V3I8]